MVHICRAMDIGKVLLNQPRLCTEAPGSTGQTVCMAKERQQPAALQANAQAHLQVLAGSDYIKCLYGNRHF